jgi:hypothetical protein
MLGYEDAPEEVQRGPKGKRVHTQPDEGSGILVVVAFIKILRYPVISYSHKTVGAT